MAVSQEKISVYNLADLKNTSDDAIPNYLNSLGFRQSHRLTDVRLALGYAALALAAATFAWDYKLGFAATKLPTAAAVVAYAALNGCLTAWILYAERGTVYVGTSPRGGATLRVSTRARKNVPVYEVTVEVETYDDDDDDDDAQDKDGKQGKKKKEKMKKKKKKEVLEIRRSFTEWFDGAGRFVAAPFQSMLAGSVPVIGRLDPKRAAPAGDGAGGASQPPAYTPEMLDALAQANVSVVGSAAEVATGSEAAAGAKKGGKRRKA